MFNKFVLLGFFGVFFSPLGMISYICILKGVFAKFSLFDVLFIAYIFSNLIVNILIGDPVLSITTFRFYFGFIVFYLFFKVEGELPVKAIMLFLLMIIPMEAILINTILPAQMLPNFPDASAHSHFNIGGYQRPYSFGGNASVASSLLVVLMSMYVLSRIQKSAFIGCMLLFASGSGFFSLLTYFFLRLFKFFVLLLPLVIILIGAFHQEVLGIIDSLGLKFNSGYVEILIEFKRQQFMSHFTGFTIVDYIFGNIDSLAEGYGGDFAWLYFVLGYGLLSFCILIGYILSKITRSTAIPIIVILVATFHYPVIFFLPGQILLGYLMSRKSVNSNYVEVLK
ncbi:hypothetical protein Sps_03719 [Shewanella psychrophila]|uniref:O-antigen ligase like membrane protein n=1 Tax=Shewanella psychrophila TaxID=225848 RepID=A0A1S6HTF3_9GAMM|nr:hypothetical protein [Shewanella psychrophila]AQS38837.1 hypothetical protein Sps_03719 [Shewanella psychrophila]